MTVSTSDALKQTFRDVAIGMVITDPDGLIEQTNDAFCGLLGYDASALHGRAIASLIHPDDRTVDADALRDLLSGMRSSAVITKRFVHADGHGIWGDVHLSVIRDADGAPAWIVRMTEDVTERKRAQVERDRFFELSLDMLSIANYDGWFTHVNPAWTRCLGWTAEELTGRPLIEFVHPDDRDAIHADRKKIFPGQPMRDIENRYRCKDGSYRWLSWSVHPQVDTRQVIGVVRDITQKKRDEAERRLLEARVMRAQRMEGIGTLAGGIAHDLNNVLSPIMLSIEILKAGLPLDEQRSVLETIEVSARRGAEMVRQVLSYARGVEGDRVVLALPDLLREVRALVSERFMTSVQFHTSLPEHLSTFLGDATQLQQVLLNLCVNARDAMPSGGTITISARDVVLQGDEIPEPDVTPGPFLQIDVQDTGSGIAPEHLDKIFDPFFTTKGIGEGSGLGLSTSHAIVRSHGGFFQVESTPGVGTTFRVFLPASATPAAPITKAPPVLPPGAGECILVVEDEAPLRRIIEATLRRNGYRVLVATNGAEAVAIFSTQPDDIALVLTDVMMPVMDGIAAIKALRALAPSLRIIAASGLATTERRNEALREGASHFLAKPFTTEALLTTLRSALHAATEAPSRGQLGATSAESLVSASRLSCA